MTKLALVAITLIGLTASAHANELVAFVASCKPLEANKDFLENRYNEYPFAGGPSVIRTTDGEFVPGAGKIYVDPNKKGFTVLMEFPEINKSCVLLMGDDFAPIINGDPT